MRILRLLKEGRLAMCLVKEMTGTLNDIGTRQFDTKYLREILLNRMRYPLSRRR